MGMSGTSVALWLALVVAYVAIGRLRGSTWRSIIRMPMVILAVVFIEFAGPAMRARRGDLRIVVISTALLAFGVSWGAWRTLGSREPRARDAIAGEATASG